MKKELKINKNDVFYIAFFIYLIYSFINTTMITDVIPNIIMQITRFTSLILLVIKFTMDKHSKKSILVYFVLIVFFIISIYYSKYSKLFDILLFIITSKDVDLKKVAKLYFYTCLIALLFTMLLAKLQIIENLIYYRNGIKRISFGCVYPTDFAAHVVFLVLAYIYLKEGNLKIYHYIIIFLSSMFVHHYCDARLDTLTILLSIGAIWVYSKFEKVVLKNKIIKCFLTFPFVICATIIIMLTINYNSNSKFYKNIDSLFSNRLQIGNSMIERNGISLFGQNIEMHGWGRNTSFNYEKYEYNYVDSSYIRILLLYGVVTFIIIGIGNIYMCKKALKKENYIMSIIMLIISINSIIAQHYFDFSYNFLLTMCFACFDLERGEQVLNTMKKEKSINE